MRDEAPAFAVQEELGTADLPQTLQYLEEENRQVCALGGENARACRPNRPPAC
jgi:hypothetical protein